MTEPRAITLTLGDIRGLTILEAARANTLADVRQGDVQRLLGSLDRGDTEPELVEKAFTLLYAYAYQIERRQNPATTWAEAQTWRVALDLETRDDLADAEAKASVDAAIVTGLPPAIAGSLTVAQMEEYRAVSDERERVVRQRRGRRAG